MGGVRAENSDYNKNYGKNTKKKQYNSSRIHTPLTQGLVEGCPGLPSTVQVVLVIFYTKAFSF